MKKLLKAIVCILIAGLMVFGFVAKYQTHGIYLGQTVDISQLEAAAQAAGSKLVSSGYSPCYCTYQNAFGKSVVIARGNLSTFQRLVSSVCKPSPLKSPTIRISSATFTTEEASSH